MFNKNYKNAHHTYSMRVHTNLQSSESRTLAGWKSSPMISAQEIQGLSQKLRRGFLRPLGNAGQWLYRAIVLLFGQFRWSLAFTLDNCMLFFLFCKKNRPFIIWNKNRIMLSIETENQWVWKWSFIIHVSSNETDFLDYLPSTGVIQHRILFRVRQEVRETLLPRSKVGGRCRIRLQLHPSGCDGKYSVCMGVYVFETLTGYHAHRLLDWRFLLWNQDGWTKWRWFRCSFTGESTLLFPIKTCPVFRAFVCSWLNSSDLMCAYCHITHSG